MLEKSPQSREKIGATPESQGERSKRLRTALINAVVAGSFVTNPIAKAHELPQNTDAPVASEHSDEAPDTIDQLKEAIIDFMSDAGDVAKKIGTIYYNYYIGGDDAEVERELTMEERAKLHHAQEQAQEILTMSEDEPILDLVERMSDGVEGNVLEQLKPELRDLAFKARYEYGFFLYQEDGVWNMGGLKTDHGEHGVTIDKNQSMETAKYYEGVTDIILFHNHPLYGDLAQSDMVQYVSEEELQFQIDLLEKGIIVTPNLPSAPDLAVCKEVRDVVKAVNPNVTFSDAILTTQGIWKVNCNNVEETMSPQDTEEFRLQSELSKNKPYSPQATSGVAAGDFTKYEEELARKNTLAREALEIAEKYGYEFKLEPF